MKTKIFGLTVGLCCAIPSGCCLAQKLEGISELAGVWAAIEAQSEQQVVFYRPIPLGGKKVKNNGQPDSNTGAPPDKFINHSEKPFRLRHIDSVPRILQIARTPMDSAAYHTIEVRPRKASCSQATGSIV